MTPNFADRVSLMTEEHIDPVEAHNAFLLHGVRQVDAEADAAARRAITDIYGAARLRDLVELTRLRGRGFRAVVRLIRNRELELVTHERMTHDALVRRRPS